MDFTTTTTEIKNSGNNLAIYKGNFHIAHVVFNESEWHLPPSYATEITFFLHNEVIVK